MMSCLGREYSLLLELNCCICVYLFVQTSETTGKVSRQLQYNAGATVLEVVEVVFTEPTGSLLKSFPVKTVPTGPVAPVLQ